MYLQPESNVSARTSQGLMDFVGNTVAEAKRHQDSWPRRYIGDPVSPHRTASGLVLSGMPSEVCC